MGLETATILGISAALSAVGTGVAVYSSIEQGKQAEAAAEHNARLAEREALIKQQTAAENIRRQRENNRRYLSRQRALFAGRGISMEGTALIVMGKTASRLELGIQDAFRDAQLGIQYSQSQAALSRFEGAQAGRAAQFSAGSSLLTGAADFAGSAYRFQQNRPQGGGG